MGDRLATTDTGRKVGDCCAPFRWGELGPHLTQCSLGRGLPPYQLASSWSIQPFGHNTSTLQDRLVSDIAIFVLKRDVKLQLTN